MNENLIIFKGLYGDESQNQPLEFIHSEPLESRSKMYNWEIQEHLHTDFAQLFILEEGGGILYSERKEIPLIAPCIVIIPSNVLHGFALEEKTIGDVLTFNDSLLEKNFRSYHKVIAEFENLICINFTNHNDIFDQINTIKKIINRELQFEMSEKRLFLSSLFKILFLAIYRHIPLHQNTTSNTDNKTLQYFQQFQKEIRKGYFESKTVGQYAKEIGITTVHLNRVCKAVVDKSPIRIIHDRLIAEAKKYLLNTSYSVQEISYFLNFNDPAYFTRLFKKNVGVSPSDFRKN